MPWSQRGGAIVTVDFSGAISDGYMGPLTGETFSGQLVYDTTSTGDANSGPGGELVAYQSAVSSLTLSFAGANVSTWASKQLGVQNYTPESGTADGFVLFAWGDHITSNLFRIYLFDSTGSTFTSGALPTSLSLSAFDLNYVQFEPVDALSRYGEITSLTTSVDGVPEPATWALMICGLGSAGAMVRRRLRMHQANAAQAGGDR